MKKMFVPSFYVVTIKAGKVISSYEFKKVSLRELTDVKLTEIKKRG